MATLKNPVFLFYLLFLLLTHHFVSSYCFSEIWLPTAARMKALEKRSTCDDINTAKLKVEVSIPEKENDIENLTQNVKEFWGRFEACAKENGIQSIRNENDEVKAASLCRPQHEAWQAPGNRLVLEMKELEESKKVLKEL